MKRRGVAVLFLKLCLLLLMTGGALAGEQRPETRGTSGAANSRYTIGVIPFYSPEKIWVLYAPSVDYLKKETGSPWQLRLYHNHDALIHDLCSGELGIAFLGPVPLGRAYLKCGAEPFLVALNSAGKPSYRSVIVTGDATITALNGLRGRTFGFFKGSTAAHVIPAKMLKDEGIGLDDIRPVFLESQDRIISALLTGSVAAAGVKESLFRKFERESLRVLKISFPLPNFAFCSPPSQNPTTQNQLASTLLRLKPLTNSRDAATVKGWDDEIRNGFMLPDEDFRSSVLGVHRIAREVMYED